MNSTRTNQIAQPAMDVECPWCAGEATLEVVMATRASAATFRCTTCSVDVAVAADPIATSIARAA